MEDQDKIGIIGVNGTGKSTFLRVIAGSNRPTPVKYRWAIASGFVTSRRIRSLIRTKPSCEVFEGDLPEMKAVREYTETMELLEHPVMRSSSRNC